MKVTSEIAIVDFGSQYTHLIARRIRELGVVSHIYPNDVKAAELAGASGVILSGGPRSVVKEAALAYDPDVFKLGIPILGLCYGHQLMAALYGGAVESGEAREYGLASLSVSSSPIFKGVRKKTAVWMSHGDHVSRLPTGFKQIASTGNGSIAAMADETKKWYGFQFHPEVAHSQEGKKMLSRFVFDICKAQKNWSTEEMLTKIEDDIRAVAGNKNVFLLVSGGVDSTVCFALLNKILGKKRVYGLTVDHGFARLGEVTTVTKALKKIGLDGLHVYDAENEFLQALKNISEPEEKRKIIGNLFLDIAERVMKQGKMDDHNWLLGQGTIYPDTIESGGTKNADIIKTHHNRVPRVQKMIADGTVIEPLRELYKDEVREIGVKLGLPKKLIYRHPFPGPGLAIRCLCSSGSNKKAIELDHGFGKNISLLRLPIKSVGVQGDERSYAHPALITSLDAVSAKKRWDAYTHIAPGITNSLKGVNRVLWLAYGQKDTVKMAVMHRAFLTRKRLDTLRAIDAIVQSTIQANPKCKKIWQFPVVLVPYGYNHRESVVLRPVESEEAMTVSFAKIPTSTLNKIVTRIQALEMVDYIFYDVTNKPPGTIEWE